AEREAPELVVDLLCELAGWRDHQSAYRAATVSAAAAAAAAVALATEPGATAAMVTSGAAARRRSAAASVAEGSLSAEALKDGQHEGCGLPGAGLGQAEHVAAL